MQNKSYFESMFGQVTKLEKDWSESVERQLLETFLKESWPIPLAKIFLPFLLPVM